MSRHAMHDVSACHSLPSSSNKEAHILLAAYGRVYRGRWNGAIVAVKVRPY